LEVVDDLGEAVLVVRQDRGQLRHGERERGREAHDQPEDGDEGQGRGQPLRQTASLQVSGQRIHGDDENEREEDGPDDLGELPNGENRHQNPRQREHEDEAARKPRPRCSRVVASAHPATLMLRPGDRVLPGG